MSNNKLFLILGNQLFNPKLYFENILEYDFFMCEDYELCNYVKHHKLKIPNDNPKTNDPKRDIPNQRDQTEDDKTPS